MMQSIFIVQDNFFIKIDTLQSRFQLAFVNFEDNNHFATENLTKIFKSCLLYKELKIAFYFNRCFALT